MSIPKELDESIKQIIAGQMSDYILYSDNIPFSKYIYNQLLLYSNNANCLFYLGILIQYRYYNLSLKWEDSMQYIEKAAEYDHSTAIYLLGLRQYSKIRLDINYEKKQRKIDLDEARKQGIKAFMAGYGSNLKKDRVMFDQHYNMKYKNECMIRTIQELRNTIKTLESKVTTLETKNSEVMKELELETLRPPEIGGSQYEKIKSHFESISY